MSGEDSAPEIDADRDTSNAETNSSSEHASSEHNETDNHEDDDWDETVLQDLDLSSMIYNGFSVTFL